MANEKRLIDANALLEQMQYRLPHNDRIAEIINTCVEIARKAVINAPTVDAVEVVHGRWLEGNSRQPCSVCRYRGMKSWNYCPNCGAKMDGDGNGNK